ncbi:MAG: NUDIX domain-containing protein, partial [Pseudomonadota bacterium]
MFITRQPRLKIRKGHKRDMRTQFAALCYRVRNDKTQILLVTSRTSGRWILPKGWPEHGLTAPAAAAKEAFEEGGVQGVPYDTPVGLYTYSKTHGPTAGLP